MGDVLSQHRNGQDRGSRSRPPGTIRVGNLRDCFANHGPARQTTRPGKGEESRRSQARRERGSDLWLSCRAGRVGDLRRRPARPDQARGVARGDPGPGLSVSRPRIRPVLDFGGDSAILTSRSVPSRIRATAAPPCSTQPGLDPSFCSSDCLCRRDAMGESMVGPTPLIDKLRELGRNLWWTWQPNVIGLFRELDPTLWQKVDHNPVEFLKRIPAEQLERRAAEMALDSRIDYAFRRLSEYLKDTDSWGAVHASILRVAAGGLLLGRVRPAREPADLLRRPGRAGRRPPQERQRPGHPADRHRPRCTTRATSASRSTPTAGSRRAT